MSSRKATLLNSEVSSGLDLSNEAHQRFLEGRNGSSRRSPSPRKPSILPRRRSPSLSPRRSSPPRKLSPKECLRHFLRGLENVSRKSRELDELISSTRELMKYVNPGEEHPDNISSFIGRVTTRIWVVMKSHSAHQVITNILPSVKVLSLHRDIFDHLITTILTFAPN